MKILGIDPGLITTGWGIVSKVNNSLSYVASGIIKTPVKLPLDKRLLFIHNKIIEIIDEHTPLDEMAIEETFVNNNNATSLKLAHARGVLMMSCSLMNLKVSEYTPNHIKKSVTGSGHASKEQVEKMLEFFLPLAKIDIKTKDTSDALAIALTHAYNINERIK